MVNDVTLVARFRNLQLSEYIESLNSASISRVLYFFINDIAS